jgi:hypothetical protein
MLLLFVSCSAPEEIPEPVETMSDVVLRTFEDGEFVNKHGDGPGIIGFVISARPFEDYDNFGNTPIPDPGSIEGFENTLPYNYDTDLQSAASYFSTCLSAGFSILEFKQDNLSVETTLVLNDEKIRLVIYETKMKIYAKGLEKEEWR